MSILDLKLEDLGLNLKQSGGGAGLDSRGGRPTLKMEHWGVQNLPAAVLEALARLGERFGKRGVHLLLFGSFARGTAFAKSDLDIAVQWQTSPGDSRLWMELDEAIENLPTVRRVDLVDLEKASESVAREALREGIPLEQLLGIAHEKTGSV